MQSADSIKIAVKCEIERWWFQNSRSFESGRHQKTRNAQFGRNGLKMIKGDYNFDESEKIL